MSEGQPQNRSFFMNPKKHQSQDQCLHEPDAAVSLLRKWVPITAMTAENSKDRLIFHRPPPFVTFPEANSLGKDAPKLDEARAMYSVLAEATRNPSASSS